MTKQTIILERTRPNIPWEGCINSVNYRIERGVPVEVPAFLADFIKNSEAERKRSERRLAVFTTPTGLKLY